MVAGRRTRSSEATIREDTIGHDDLDRVVICYAARRHTKPPRNYWALVETGRGTIHARGSTRLRLEADLVGCAVALGYDRDGITLIALD